MKLLKVISLLFITLFMIGCASNLLKNDRALFAEGLTAIENRDFAAASSVYSELAKKGDPGAMNNLGVSLLMVDRKDEALYWFKKASRYGDANAKITLKRMGESVPPSDLIDQHPTQLQQEAARQLFVTTIVGLAVGVTAYYAGKAATSHYDSRSYNIRSQSNSHSTLSNNRDSINFGLGSNQRFGSKYDNEYPYKSFSGTSYKFDLTKPFDRIKYEIDPASQVFDSINPWVDIDRDFGQYGGGAKR
ncbi:MAG: sel1 repeat family protein [Burkholderiales bacterium]|nr:sel1 repeat family protein [Burkholderiales bacterium]